MAHIGYHASHEQFTPGELVEYAVAAERAGFASVMSSDHLAFTADVRLAMPSQCFHGPSYFALVSFLTCSRCISSVGRVFLANSPSAGSSGLSA